jgi:hypothetical protein
MHCRAVDSGVATARLIGGVGGHGADRFTFGDLVEQLWQHGAVAIAAGGKLDRPDIRSGRIHREMHLAPPLGRLLRNPLPGNDWRRP